MYISEYVEVSLSKGKKAQENLQQCSCDNARRCGYACHADTKNESSCQQIMIQIEERLDTRCRRKRTSVYRGIGPVSAYQRNTKFRRIGVSASFGVA